MIRLTDAAKYYKGLPHQAEAFNYLQSLLMPAELEEFAKRYRNAPAFTWKSEITGTIVKRILALGFKLERGTDYIVGIEGVGTDLKPNKDLLDQWNDSIGLLKVNSNGGCTILGLYVGTTEPGRYYTANPMNPRGGARVLADSFNKDVWVRGTHIRMPNCLIQTGSPITVTRDTNKDGQRGASELKETGYFGINFHHTNDQYSINSIGRWSAGCCVVRSKAEHQRIMANLNPAQKKFTYILLDGHKL